MESRKSVKNLAETIHSLLGMKAHLTSAWVKSVCNIVKNVSAEEASSPPSALKTMNFQARNSSGEKGDDSSATEVQNIRDELSALNGYVNELNIQRRRALNDFLDLKGNIRVFCRIRPIGIGEHSGRLRPVLPLDSGNVILKVAENKSKSYNFDKVFHPGSSQDEVFSEIEPVIKSVLDGYNACIFAYGQTGTGKTFTMEGTLDAPGVVPRAIEALFKQAGESNHAFLISFSMLEIYLGNLRDLLVPQPTKPTDPMPPCLSMHTNPKGGIEIENLVSIKVSDFHQALKLYKLGSQYRSTASTNSNMTSSRSHCMIRISISSFDAPDRQRETNKIWLVDLGGSERVLKTKASGRRLDEGKAINLSLSALGDVINALQRRKRHIPYRNSKLTQALKDSLGQDSKTLMLVHVSPKEEDLCETICSLNFATRAKSIHLGNEESTEARERKEAAMKNLLQTMESIEEERQRVTRDIKKLYEKLDNFTGGAPSLEDHMDASYLTAEEILCNPEVRKNGVGDVSGASSSKLPSFMRPTVSSKRKSGMDNQTSDLLFARRRPFSRRAQSVAFPVKKNSEYTSDRSISKSTFGAGLTTKSNADNVTEYSQDISECDIKVVVSEDKEKSPRISKQQRANLFSHLEKHEDGKINTGNSTKFSKVDNWLRLQKKESKNNPYTHRNKRVIATPVPEKTHNYKERKTSKPLPDVKKDSSTFLQQKIVELKKIDEHVNVHEIESSKTEEGNDKPIVMLKDLFAEEAKSNLNCPSVAPVEQRMTQTESEDDLSMDESECGSLYPPTAGYDGHSQCTDDNEDYILSVIQETEAKTHLSDRFMVDHSNCQCSPEEVDYSADTERDSCGSMSVLERESLYEQLATEMDVEDDEQEKKNVSLKLSPKGTTPSLLKPKSQRALFMDNSRGEDLMLPFVSSQGRLNDKGTLHILQQKIQTLWFSGLVGLGFLELGYDHDFFHGLML